MEVVFSEICNVESADVYVFVSHDNPGDFVASKLRSSLGVSISDQLFKEMTGAPYAKFRTFGIVAGGRSKDVIIVSAGDRNLLSRASLEKLGGYIYDHVKIPNSKICVFNEIECKENECVASYIASGMILKSWTFDKYKSEKSQGKVSAITCQTTYVKANKEKFAYLESIISSVFKVRNMVAEPANVMDPDGMLEEARLLKKLGVKISVVEEPTMRKLGMDALLGVAKGSDNPSYVITMEYRPDESKDEIALVGKGLTFDSGGLCLKPAKGMADMKGDMTGAAVVIGVMHSIAQQKLPVNVVGCIGVVENMISGRAQKPGDVVRAMSGKTIEVDNTDAEGRLVLADVLSYVQNKYSPKVIIDFATLTGAIQVSLGHEFAGLFSNSDDLSSRIEQSSKEVGEKVWRFPMHPSYRDDIKSDIADIKNVGSGRGAGSITAAMFLNEFIKDGVKWAHIDIAATEWDTKSRALSQKGATGFGVRLIEDFLRNYYSLSVEKKAEVK